MDFEKQFDKVVKQIPLEEVRSYVASAENGKLVFVPRIKRYGAEMIWECRVHINGAMGPVRLSEEAIRAINAPEEWYQKARAFKKYLQKNNPVMEIPESTDRTRIAGEEEEEELF